MQTPAMQLPTEQGVPSATFTSPHVPSPLVGSQATAPVWHSGGGTSGVQALPGTQVQAPARQSIPMSPQLVSSGRFDVEQTGAPLVGSHAIAAVWHTVGGVAGVHAPPATHTQAPVPSQARSCPHEVPLGRFDVAQNGAPLVGSHATAAVWHTVGGVAGVHVPPATHTQAPLPSQARSCPHEVPPGRFVTAQLAAPVVGSQATAAVWHTVGGVAGVHVPPATQTQAPSWQVRSAPHVVPFVRFVTVHTGAPVAGSHVTAAVWHAVSPPAGTHAAPGEHTHAPS